MCSTVCRWTSACGRGSTKASGRPPPGSSSYRLKSTGWGGGVVRNLAVYFVSLSSSPALAFLCPREEWCNVVARAAAIDCCSCRQAARSRRPLRRWAAPVTGCQLRSISQQVTHKNSGHTWERRLVVVVVVGCCGVLLVVAVVVVVLDAGLGV